MEGVSERLWVRQSAGRAGARLSGGGTRRCSHCRASWERRKRLAVGKIAPRRTALRCTALHFTARFRTSPMRPDTVPGSPVTAMPEKRSLLPAGLEGSSAMLMWHSGAAVGWIWGGGEGGAQVSWVGVVRGDGGGGAAPPKHRGWQRNQPQSPPVSKPPGAFPPPASPHPLHKHALARSHSQPHPNKAAERTRPASPSPPPQTRRPGHSPPTRSGSRGHRCSRWSSWGGVGGRGGAAGLGGDNGGIKGRSSGEKPRATWQPACADLPTHQTLHKQQTRRLQRMEPKH